MKFNNSLLKNEEFLKVIEKMKYMEAREVRNCSLDDLNKMIKLLAFAKSDQVRTEINKQHKFKLEKQINYEQ